ncbi:hypothetical protein [Oricola sp.]|uniref:hypothetical protein n=1 Tax=Oricola sp. TaxID=1979950 RepID=UPI003BA8883E
MNIVAATETTRPATIVDALAMWGEQWSGDVPPVDSTGDTEADAKLARVFDDLIRVDSDDDALRIVQDQLFHTDHFPDPTRDIEAWRPVLMRWWLAIFEASQ